MGLMPCMVCGALAAEWLTAAKRLPANRGNHIQCTHNALQFGIALGSLCMLPFDVKSGPVTSTSLHLARPIPPLSVSRIRAGLSHRRSLDNAQVKTLTESTGEVDEATPSLAVQMAGLNSVPTAGDEFYVCVDETEARKAAEIAEDTQVTLQQWKSGVLIFLPDCLPLHAK